MRLTEKTESGEIRQLTTRANVLCRLAELEDKLESGQALELPFNVGEKVYLVRRNRNLKCQQTTTKLTKNLKHNRHKDKCASDSERHEPQDMFATKEQAETRLKELQENL